MATVTFKQNTEINLVGELPAVGSAAPDFKLVKTDLSEVSLASFDGKVVLNIFPSVDTGICAMSVRAFNERAAGLDGVRVVNVSADLPFAHKRFCGAEGIDNVDSTATFRGSFLDDYGVRMLNGPLAGLAARAIVVLNADNTVAYTELVPEIVQEPNYDAAIAAL